MNHDHAILIVEDEPGIAENISYALQTEGFSPQWCSTAGEAEECFQKQSFALILLDVGLPDGNGFELCKTFRKKSTVPIIFLTARKDEIDRVVGLEIGGDDYMVKPFSPRELTARIKAILRRTTSSFKPTSPSAEMSSVSIGEFVIDDLKKEIRFRDQPLALSRYEFRLLKVLTEHPGRVFSREQLMNHAWEEPEASLDRTVDAHIKKLRAKLKTIAPDKEIIKTHRGMGYSLNP